MNGARRLVDLRLAAALAVACLSCGGSDAKVSPVAPLSDQVEELEVEIDYQDGAAPFVGSAGQFEDVWRVTRDNLTRMMQSTGARVTVPSTLEGMEKLAVAQATTFTSEAILDIAEAHRGAARSPTKATLYVVFLDGYFADDTGRREDVLGISIGRTGVIGMFKPVIASAEATFPGVARFVEQATLVHELGHAFGLVAGDIADTSGHHDSAHPRHCTNDSCAMYWANEGLSAAVTFARRFMRTGSTILLDAACLADLDAAGR